MTYPFGPSLETDRLILRPPTASDWPFWEAFEGSDRARFIGGPYSSAQSWGGFCLTLGHWVFHGFGPFTVCLKDRADPIGMVGPWDAPERPGQEVGWKIWDGAAEGHSFAAEATGRVLHYVFETLRWTTAVSYVSPENTRSIALAERLGATIDPKAARPQPDDLVYRHARPSEAQT